MEFENCGLGILKEELDTGIIFQLGYRGVLASDRSRIGAGLGLYIIKKIVDRHRGTVSINSEKIGIGEKIDPYRTSVKVCLPITQKR